MTRLSSYPQLIVLALIVSSASLLPCSAQTGQTPAQPSSAATTNGGTQPASPPVQSATGATGPSPADATRSAQAATTAVNNAASSVSKASDAIDKAGKYAKAIQDITGSTTKSSQSVLDNLQTLQSTIDAIGQNKVLNALSTALKDLDPAQTNTPESAVRTACDKSKLQQPAGGDQQDVTSAIAKCDAAQKEAASPLAATTPALTGLQTAIQSISPYLAKQFDTLAGTLKSVTDAKLTPPDASADAGAAKGATDATPPAGDGSASKPVVPSPGPSAAVLLQVLPKGLPALKHVLESIGQYTAAWNAMKPTIQSPGAGYTSAGSAGTADGKNPPPANGAGADPDAALKKLQDSVDNIETKLAPWFAAISGQLTADAQTLDGKLAGVATDPAKNSAEALGDVRDKTDTLAAVQSVVDAWPPLVGFLGDSQPPGLLSTTRKSFEDMQKRTNTLRASISRVHDALAGDFTDFETDQVSLYYFTDVPRLMYALNDRFQTMGGVAEAKAQADEQRTSLTKTELDLADAQATVNRYQKQVLDLQEQQRQANEKLKGLNSNLSKLASRLQQSQTAKQTADSNYDTAVNDQKNSATTTTSSVTGASTTSPPDPTLAANVDKSKAKQTAAATNLSNAQSNYDAAKTERDNAQAQADDTQNQKDSLPAKLEAAQQALSGAQTTVSAERRKMLLTAQTESDAFAFARDNTPFMVAFADASSSDPAKRVILYAFNDSKTIFMRGKPDDISVVKRMIAEFDTPAPQARLTLWTFQLSAESGQKTNKKAAGQLNRAMEIVDKELGDTRALENTVLASLRGTINDFVSSAADQLHALNCTPLGLGEQDCAKLRRISFYDPSVLTQVNFIASNLNLTPSAGETQEDHTQRRKTALERLQNLVPDPAQTTTLGEALLVLNLARPVTRNCVRYFFENEIRVRVPDFGDVKLFQYNALLPLTWHALGVWNLDSGCSAGPDQFSLPTAGLSSSQLEIVTALRVAHDRSVLRATLRQLESQRLELLGIPDLSRSLDELRQQRVKLEERGKGLLSKPEADHLKALETNPNQPSHDDAMAKAMLTAKAIKSLPLADQIAYNNLDGERLALETRVSTIKKRSAIVLERLRSYGIYTSDIVDQESFRRVKEQILNHPGFSATAPRVAAADEMLKELIIAVEDDLARDFVQPMINRLRLKLMTTGASVGVVQRESMLATNRGVARIDPRASAQLAVGDQEDILSGVQQLAQLYGAVQSGGALAALGALQQQPREPQPEIYALNTGNKFQVTPVFDPTGQALRFKFDFVATANVQEPNGTTNTQLSRIERHTVNTEVQLSNLETREISRFEVNARLGLPTTYWGGIPILKDIPYIRPWVPLVGWFVRKGGSNASGQQSVIFGQTTIYPTIGALVDLISDPGAIRDTTVEQASPFAPNP